MEGKKWYTSKTIWFNALLGGIVAFTEATGHPIPKDVLASIVTIGNVLLRLITKGPVTS